MAIRASRPMLVAGSVLCGIAAVALSFVAIEYWRSPDFKDEGLPLVLFFDVVFAYRMFWYLKLIPQKKIRPLPVRYTTDTARTQS
jgi:hypothetical protein